MRSYDDSKQIELISLLRHAHDEIETLCRENARLAPYERVLSILERALFGAPPVQGYGEDVKWRITKAIDVLMKEREEAAQAAARAPKDINDVAHAV